MNSQQPSLYMNKKSLSCEAEKILNHEACRVILDFRAEQDKLELYLTLILVFYLSYHFNGYSRFFTFLYLKNIIFRIFK